MFRPRNRKEARRMGREAGRAWVHALRTGERSGNSYWVPPHLIEPYSESFEREIDRAHTKGII